MKASELRTKTPEELHKLLGDKRAELLEKRRSLAAQELTNPRSISNIRRQIAVLLTVIREQAAKQSAPVADEAPAAKEEE